MVGVSKNHFRCLKKSLFIFKVLIIRYLINGGGKKFLLYIIGWIHAIFLLKLPVECGFRHSCFLGNSLHAPLRMLAHHIDGIIHLAVFHVLGETASGKFLK